MRSPLPFVWYPAKNLDVGSGIAGYYNMVRDVISTLIKEGNEKQPMDAKKRTSNLRRTVSLYVAVNYCHRVNVYKVIDINNKKSVYLTPSVLDKEDIAYVGDNYNLRCKHCWHEWTESWRPSMAKENKPSPK
jgi:hypothetical protein